MNAYKNNHTAFSKQLLKNNETDFYFSDNKKKGCVSQLNFRVNDQQAKLQIDSVNIDVAKLVLPQPLLPHHSIIITTTFHDKLPYNISRGGYVGQTFQATQWFPKPAVYDSKGWHPFPYLELGEFYSEFGNWKVNITVPSNYIIAASGNPQNDDEKKYLLELSNQKPSAQKNYELFHQLLNQSKKKYLLPETLMPPSSSQTKTLTYTLNNAHDFAWFASKLFLVQHDTVQLSNHVVNVFSYYNPWQAKEWQQSIQYMKDAVHFYSNNVGDYSYDVVSAVAGNEEQNSGGMEYPTITLITTNGSQQELDATLAHEIGHNWLYGMLGTNERDHAWMDEGINTYYQHRYENQKYGKASDAAGFKHAFMRSRIPISFNNTLISTLEKIKKDQPIDLTSATYTELNYGLIVYEKTPIWMHDLQQQLGTLTFDSSMKFYFNQWQFKHIYPENFKQAIEQSSGSDIDSLYQKIFTIGPIKDNYQHKQIRFATFFNLKQTDKYNYVSLLPVAGYNNYDKLMIGAAIHNYQLPLNKFDFFVAPLYAIASKKLNGATRFSYNIFKRRYWLEFSVSGTTYSFNKYDSLNTTFYQRMQRIVPSAKLVLYNKDQRSTKKIIIQARSFLLREDVLPDTINIASKQKNDSYINHLNITMLDNRKLFPYSVMLTIDQGKQFVRAGLTGKYFFNFSNHSGINARLFAGKFFYLSSSPNTYQLQRYNLTLKGANGYQDYTYSNYFIGRSEVNGRLSQQLMERDGFLKVGTNADISDNWLVALNLTSDIPGLTKQLPIKVFADVGALRNEKKYFNTTTTVRYDAGLQVSALHSAMTIYLPLLYSKVYSNYYKTIAPNHRFKKTISFNIDLNIFKLNNISNKIPL